MFQSGHLTGRVALERIQLLALLLDFGDQLRQAHNLSLDRADFGAAFFGEISIVGQGAAETGRVALIEQQLELFLAADHVSGLHLRGQGGPFGLQGVLLTRLLAAQFRAAPFCGRLFGMQRVQPSMLRGNGEFGLAQPRAQRIALLEILAQAVRELGNACAHGREFCLCLRGVGGFERSRPRAAAAQCGRHDGCTNASKTVISGAVHSKVASIQALCPLLYLSARQFHCASRMQRLFEFIGNHPFLASAAILAAAAVAIYEIRERMQAFAALSAMQAVRLMNQGALVIDLRAKELYDAGHIGDARNVPAADLESQADSLKKWRDKNVITYCDSGASGASGARTLMKLGFTKVFNLHGGLNAWVKDNLPLAKTLPAGKGSAK